MNTRTRRRIKLNRHLRAEPGRKRAYREARARGDLDGMLVALYPSRPVRFPLGVMGRIGLLGMVRKDWGRG